VRWTTSRLPLFLLALGLLASPAAAGDRPPLPLPLLRSAQEPSNPPHDPGAAPEPPIAADDETDPFAQVGHLLQSRCAMPGCHLGPEAKAGLRLEVGQIYSTAVNVRARTEPSLLRVVPRSPEQSLLFLKLLPQDQGHYRGPRMPLSMDPLSAEEIARVRRWIESFPADRWPSPSSAEASARPPRTFHDSALVNLPTPDPIGRRALEFRILHRFKAPARDAGSHDFYGLDSDAWVSIGLAYGLADTVEVGLRRTNLQHDVEAYSKWAPIRQRTGGAPLSLALRGSYSNLRETIGVNRNRYGAQAVLARRFGDHLSLMLVPTYVTGTNYVDAVDERATGAVGVGGEWRLNTRMAVTGEWIAQLSGVRNDFQSGSIGFSIATARHAFHVFATNTAGAQTDLYVTGGDVKLRDGDFRLGFNISRTFTPH
jgi:hypothetical protein